MLNNKKLKILIFTGHVYNGAVQSSCDIINILQRKYNCEITVVISDKGEVSHLFDKWNIQYVIVPHTIALSFSQSKEITKTYYEYFKNAINILEQCIDINSFDLIYTNSCGEFVSLELGKKYGIPCITHIRNYGIEDEGLYPVIKDFKQKLLAFDHYITISNDITDYFISYGIDSNKITRIYNGIRLNEFIPNDYINLSKSKTLNILMSGRITKFKCQIHALEALKQLPENILSNIHLDIYGRGNPKYIKDMLQYIKQNQLEKIVSYKGHVYTMNNKMQGYNIGLVCSAREAFGRVTAEYMAAGICPIVSDTGANTELITNNYNGLVYKFGDINDLSKCIEKLYLNRNILASIIMNAISSSKNYDINKCTNEIYETLIKVIKKKTETL